MTSASGGSCYLLNPEWDSLPLTVVFLILDKLLEPADHVRFAAICKHYYSLAKDYNQANQHTCRRNKDLLPPPMLLISNGKQTTLCSISEGKIYNNVGFPELPPSTYSCFGSTHGWLATVDEWTNKGATIALHNPFRKPSTLIRLPFLKSKYIRKVMLSADPALNPDNSYVVVVNNAFCCLGLAFTRARQQHWTSIQVPTSHVCVDAIFYKSQFYAVGRSGEILSVNLDSNSYNVPEAKLCTPEKPFSSNDLGKYLVESTKGDLLYIQRILGESTRASWNRSIDSFKVYKVVFSDADGSVVEQQVETSSIGDEALFVDDYNAVSASASNFPKCQRNSIYYTTNSSLKGPNGTSTFKFNLEDGTITQPYPLNTMQRHTPETLWIMPSYNGLC